MKKKVREHCVILMKWTFQKCTFPLSMPEDVFWIKRTPEEIEVTPGRLSTDLAVSKKRMLNCHSQENEVPLPRIDKLPASLHHLYPTIFKPKSSQKR